MRFIRDHGGGVLVEVAVLIPILFVLVLGSVDFLFALYQWNAATKAVQQGGRIATVSDPVATGLNDFSTAVLSSTVLPGMDMPAFFEVTCSGGSCSCTGGSCPGGVGSYSTTAMGKIVFGRDGAGACGDSTKLYDAGMCDFLGRIAPANVVIRYTHTGLGYAGRPGGPVPTLTVSLQNLNFEFFFLGGLLGFANIPISVTTTITGEDLSFGAPT